jgi:hypothetical protein
MDEVTIQKIAAEVVARLPYGDRYWLFLVVNVVVMAVVGALAALGTSYFRTRGQNLATKHDFDELRRQFKANTELVETIKAEVGQRDWVRREWTTLRRIKLEALLEKMHECVLYLDRPRDDAIDGVVPAPVAINCMVQLHALEALYFPELKNEVSRFSDEWHKLFRLIIEIAVKVQASAGDQEARRQLGFKLLTAQWDARELVTAEQELTAAARRLLVEIMGMDEHQ